MNCIDAIRFKYPDIQDVLYWSTKYDGTPLDNIYEGLVWNNKEIPKPSLKEIDQWCIDYDLQYRQQLAISKRQYPPIGAQLDMIYHDKIDNTSVWLETIESIKLAHPKPME